MATLEFKIKWFGKQADKLEDVAGAVEALRCDIEGINYHPIFEMTPIKSAYENLRSALLEDENSLRTGVTRYEQVAAAIRTTGRNYALEEGRATDTAAEVQRWLEAAGMDE